MLTCTVLGRSSSWPWSTGRFGHRLQCFDRVSSVGGIPVCAGAACVVGVTNTGTAGKDGHAGLCAVQRLDGALGLASYVVAAHTDADRHEMRYASDGLHERL